MMLTPSLLSVRSQFSPCADTASRGSAYRDFKAKLEEHTAGLVARGAPVPKDDVAAVKFVRMDPGSVGPENSLT